MQLRKSEGLLVTTRTTCFYGHLQGLSTSNKSGAGEGIRTLDINLGKVALCLLYTSDAADE